MCIKDVRNRERVSKNVNHVGQFLTNCDKYHGHNSQTGSIYVKPVRLLTKIIIRIELNIVPEADGSLAALNMVSARQDIAKSGWCWALYCKERRGSRDVLAIPHNVQCMTSRVSWSEWVSVRSLIIIIIIRNTADTANESLQIVSNG